MFVLPLFRSELYQDQTRLTSLLIDTLKLAGKVGAQTVSLTGLIPSATDFGQALLPLLQGKVLPTVTTGHAATAAAVVMNVEGILQRTGRQLSQECLGVLGVGSIAQNTISLMLRVLPHPRSIILCDLYQKRDMLNTFRTELRQQFNFTGEISLGTACEAKAAEEIYSSSLILGATNVADVLSIEHLQPGTIVVDDSSPHCFSPDEAMERIEKQADILVNEGGVIKARDAVQLQLYISKFWQQVFYAIDDGILWGRSPYNITGCVFASLMSQWDGIKPTLGHFPPETAVHYFNRLKKLKFSGADPHCGGSALSKDSINSFCGVYGHCSVIGVNNENREI